LRRVRWWLPAPEKIVASDQEPDRADVEHDRVDFVRPFELFAGVLAAPCPGDATGSASVTLTDNTIAANNKGLSLTSAPAHGRIISLGDNTVVNNTVAGKPTSTVPKV